jgi:hypothetical protein
MHAQSSNYIKVTQQALPNLPPSPLTQSGTLLTDSGHIQIESDK